jgi:hypothetical protein
MYVFKRIDSTNIERNVVNYTHNLTTSSLGITSKKIVSGSISQSYWNSLNVLFYSSGSPIYLNEHKFDAYQYTLAENDGLQHLNKFHGYASSSLITIPSTYYGEKIKEGSFTYTDIVNKDNAGNALVIKDDRNGNLYSSNAYYSQSSATSISSSDNYVGNIFYDLGLVVITETGSWSGSINYSDIATNYTLQFDSYNSVTTHEYSVTLKPSEFNHTMNYSIKEPLSGSYNTLDEYTGSLLETEFMAREFTSSAFSPYITEINLYTPNVIEPVIRARVAKPIRKSKILATTFKLRIDL